MSTYTYRRAEGKFPKILGAIYEYDELPDVTTMKEGDTYRIWNKDKRFMKVIDGEWKPVDDCEYEWRLLPLYTEVSRKPSRARYKDENGEWKYYEKEDRSYQYHTDEDNITKLLHKNLCFCNNGGAIRDDYISTRGFGEDNFDKFRGRGLPDNVDPATVVDMNDEEGKFHGWDTTYLTLAEWDSVYDMEQVRILDLIKKAFDKQSHDSIEKKIDFIIHHMKDPASMNIDEIYKKKVNEDGEEIDEEDDNGYYDSPEYFIDDYMPNLYLIAEEIGRIALIAEYYDIYSWDDIRVIYHLG